MASRGPAADPMVVIDDAHRTPAAWEDTRSTLEAAQWFWLATVRPDGRPHLVPLLAIWMDDALYFAASPNSRKGRNLADDPHCTIATREHGVDLVIEGEAVRVTDEARLHRLADAYADKYGWQVEVRDGALYGDGAPTAGPPPYAVYALTPATAFGFPAGQQFPPTRWRFASGSD